MATKKKKESAKRASPTSPGKKETALDAASTGAPASDTPAVHAEPTKEAAKAKRKKESISRVRQWWSTFNNKKHDDPAAESVSLSENTAAFSLRVREEKRPSGLSAFFKQINYIGMGKFRHTFIQSLALMLNAGLPLIDALQALEAEAQAKPMKKLIARITASVRAGQPLWRALEHSYFFTPYEIALVHIGEDAGNLSKNLTYLSEQQEKDHALRQKVKMAMIYPTIVLVLVFVIVMGLGMFVLPSLVQVLYSMKVTLPLSTRIIIKITNFFENYGTIVAPGCIIGFIVISLLSRFTKFSIVTQWVIFKIPGIGRLAREATIARFGVILGGLLRAGVPLVEAMESLVDVTQVASYKRFYRKLLKNVTLGDSFSKSFASIGSTGHMLPVSVQQLVVTGERSGTLSETLLKIASIYEEKASETAEKLPIILEPMLLLMIGSIVGGIAFSIITPIYSVVGNVGAH